MAATTNSPDHQVAVIGAGFSGIGMAIALRRAGIEDFVVLERGSDIGGTWRDNTYPGIAVDIPAQAYQFSYELKPDWSRVFAKGEEVKAYIDHCADRYDVRRFVRLESEVESRSWDESAHLWRLQVGGRELTARFVISAVGAFVNPKPAEIEGLDDFRGPVLRSAAWDHSVELTGKRAAIVGTGASAVQITPEIARKVARLDVYQRTPIWVGPKLDPPTPRALRWLFRRVPRIQQVAAHGPQRVGSRRASSGWSSTTTSLAGSRAPRAGSGATSGTGRRFAIPRSEGASPPGTRLAASDPRSPTPTCGRSTVGTSSW